MRIPKAVRRLAEDPIAEGAVWPATEVVRGPGYVLWFGPPMYPTLSIVQQVRIDEGGIDATVDHVRQTLRARGRSRATWQLGPSATPAGLADALCNRGMTVDDEPVLKALVLDHPPFDIPGDVAVRRVQTRSEFEAFFRIQSEAFENDAGSVERGLHSLDEMWEAERDQDVVVTYLAYLHGEPVATGRATFNAAAVSLNGGSTLHHARGRGIYRAVVGARWDDAVARGTPYLTTQARPTSHPTLKRTGFVDVCDVRILVDEF